MTTPYPALFAPIDLAGRSLRNRIVHASISTIMADRGRVTDRLVRYYATRGAGGAAMVVTEPVASAPHQTMPSRPRAYDDAELEGLSGWADAVESTGCRLIGQIQDAGRGRHIPGRNLAAIGPSPLPDDLSWTVPRVLSTDEVASLVDAFADTSARLQRCGFSGVELSAGHGHLFHQFMSPLSNIREDRYGGDFAGRLRILTDLVAAIRSACGNGFILGIKMPGDDGVPGGIDIAMACRIGRTLADLGAVDYICLAQGAHHRSLELHTPDDHFPRVPFLPLVKTFRQSVPEVALMAIGRITDPAEAEAILSNGHADLVGLGRPLITDPSWPEKARAGRAREIRYCVSGNMCWQRVVNHLPLACDNNPRVAEPDERTGPVTLARVARRVVVVGAGVAGLEAAWVAGVRGHHVTLIGRSAEVGGKARLHAALPGSESISSVYDYQFEAARRAGVRLELGTEASVAGVLALKPDAVVLATGASMIWPRSLPTAWQAEGWIPDLRTAIPGLLRTRGRIGAMALLLDIDHTEATYGAIELLASRFDHVVVVTPREAVAQDVPLVGRQGIQRRLHALRIDLRLLAELHVPADFESDSRVEIRSVFGGESQRIAEIDFLAYSTPRRPDDELAEPLTAAGLPVHRVGDCRIPGTLMAATASGSEIGYAL